MNDLLGTSDLGRKYDSYATRSLKNISDSYNNVIQSSTEDDDQSSFDMIFQSALGLINETNDYSNKAEEEELNYAMGLSEDTHTLMIAQQKANVSLEYTVAVRDAVLDAYNEIMNMQF
ncbi:MAG: flagellar hook-basal body complex protein FliE [Lachnospiraceae bacterium]|jgi:flagellar hook-basal body complex protein FliE|nr:flagellar hook-basal body complex protein FliE [Lachnospiraceae bacterium]MBQ5560785.1 flagellar hook-basal body complex protein FliE [Lachnospiraceae bacterium]MCR4801479.1 flagellar hook-basal body complex protein FliE [Lachnospiraceae bacterium]